VLERLLRAVAVIASLTIVISFVLFAVDKLDRSSSKQQQQLTQEIEQPSPSPKGEREREKRHGDVREAIDDADDFLLSPFNGIVSSSDTWVTRGVPSLLGLLAVVIITNRGGRSTSSSPPGPGAKASPTTAATAGSETGATPTGWVAYRDPTTGFTIAYPPGWSVAVNGTLTDFRDPVSGAYLRVDHREPPGPSAEGAWYEYEPSFAAQNPGYRRIRITPTTYRGYPAATWEYAYSGGGTELHAVDLGFITPGHGFALNFQATASDWDRLQSTFDGFKASFRAPSA